MATIPRGTITAVRVVESPEKRFWTKPAWDGGTGQQAPGMAWDDFNNKRIIGTAPVAADGSAYFAVPADTFIYLQLLDRTRRDGAVDAQWNRPFVRARLSVALVATRTDELPHPSVFRNWHYRSHTICRPGTGRHVPFPIELKSNPCSTLIACHATTTGNLQVKW